MDQEDTQQPHNTNQLDKEEIIPETTLDLKNEMMKVERQPAEGWLVPSANENPPSREVAQLVLEYDFKDLLKPLRNRKSPEQRMKAARVIRKFLAAAGELPLQKIIAANLIPELVKCLKPQLDFELQHEAAWALTNISSASSKHTVKLIEAGAVQPLIKLMSSADENLSAQAIWAIGNIIGDSAVARDVCLEKGAFEALMKLTTKQLSGLVMEEVAWAVSNITRNYTTSVLTADQMKILLQNLATLLTNEHEPVAFNSMFSITQITYTGKAEVDAIAVTPNLIGRIITSLSHHAPVVQNLALQALMNMVIENNEVLNTIIGHDPLQHYPKLVSHMDLYIVRDAFWLLTLMVMEGKEEFVQSIYRANFIPSIFSNLELEFLPVQKQALYCLKQMLMEYSGFETEIFAHIRIFRSIHELLSCSDKALKYACLQCANRLLEIFFYDPNVKIIARAKFAGLPSGLKKESEDAANPKIQTLAKEILQKYF